MKRTLAFISVIASLAALTSGCSSDPASGADNLCSVFQDHDAWYAAAHRTHQKYGIPMHVAFALLVHEDSVASGNARDKTVSFQNGAVIKPISEEQGYLVVDDAVWEEYLDDEGSFLSDRDDFTDALDFIGWYMTKTKERTGIAYTDAYNQYLNYREGWDAYKGGEHQGKDWLVTEAESARERAERFRTQLLHCNLY